MTRPQRFSRLGIFLAGTFAITWGSWWALVPLARGGILRFGEPLFLVLYMLGGFGPTIAAYLAVTKTRWEAPLREFNGRLLRWRVGLGWYAVALGLPFAIALGSIWLADLLEPGFVDRLRLEPWHRALLFFPAMIVGGGLEELGWRGVAQPALERRIGRMAAALITGVVWAIWHLPLFSIPGVGQYGTSFGIFAVGVVGLAFILAALYAATRSILLCVLFHAAANTAGAMGLAIPTSSVGPAIADAVVKILVGVGLVLAMRRIGSVEG